MLVVTAELPSAQDPFPHGPRVTDGRPEQSGWVKVGERSSLSFCCFLSISGAQLATLVSRIEQIIEDMLIRVSELKARVL